MGRPLRKELKPLVSKNPRRHFHKRDEGVKGDVPDHARLDDQWLGNGLRILWLVDNAFVFDPHNWRSFRGQMEAFCLVRPDQEAIGCEEIFNTIPIPSP